MTAAFPSRCDGFVEYRRATDRGLINQGWKDSFDGINDASGHVASGPMALCEVQGYVYVALQPHVPRRSLAVAPHLPDGWGQLALRRLRLGPAAADITATGGKAIMAGLPDGWQLDGLAATA